MEGASVLALVIFGIVIGWIVHFIIDYLVLRPHWIAEGRKQSATLIEEDVPSLMARIDMLNESITQELDKAHPNTALIDSLRADITAARAAQTEALEQLEQLINQKTTPIDLSDSPDDGNDDKNKDKDNDDECVQATDQEAAGAERTISPDTLTRLNGIGPATEAELNEVGIYTYDQLAVLTPEELCALLEIKSQDRVAPWINEAGVLVSARNKIEAAL